MRPHVELLSPAVLYCSSGRALRYEAQIPGTSNNKAPVPSNIYDLAAHIYRFLLLQKKLRSTNWCRKRISVDVYLPTYLFQLISIGIRYHNYEIMQMRHFSDSRSRRCAHESMHAPIRDNVGEVSRLERV